MKTMAICYHEGFLALIIVRRGAVFDWRRYRVMRSQRSRFAALIARFASEYRMTSVVLDPRQRIRLPRTITPHYLSLREAKRTLLPNGARPTHRAVVQHLADRCPTLRPLISVAAATGTVSVTKRWQMALLLAAALGFAHGNEQAVDPVDDQDRSFHSS